MISDGKPDNERDALHEARTFQSKIDVIYVGPESSPAGREFLAKLAAASGGQVVTADKAAGLALEAKRLLAVSA